MLIKTPVPGQSSKGPARASSEIEEISPVRIVFLSVFCLLMLCAAAISYFIMSRLSTTSIIMVNSLIDPAQSLLFDVEQLWPLRSISFYTCIFFTSMSAYILPVASDNNQHLRAFRLGALALAAVACAAVVFFVVRIILG